MRANQDLVGRACQSQRLNAEEFVSGVVDEAGLDIELEKILAGGNMAINVVPRKR